MLILNSIHYTFYGQKKLKCKNVKHIISIHRLIPSGWEKYDPLFHKNNFHVRVRHYLKRKTLFELLNMLKNTAEIDKDKTIRAMALRYLKRIKES